MTVASHILPAQRGIRALRPTISSTFYGGSRLNGHLEAEYPHLLAIRDPATLRAELKITRAHYNGVRLHASVGYVTPDDEHEGRGEAIRKARQAGLEQARLHRLAWHRDNRQTPPTRDPDDVG